MDTLLLSSNLAIIIEVKNIAGTLFFDQLFHQLIRTNKEGKEEGFPDPITQARLHQFQLKGFFEKHRLPQVPIEYVVVICNKNSILKTNPGHRRIFEKVFKAPHLLNRIQHLETIYQKEVLSSKELLKISKMLIKKNTPPKKLFMDRYLLSKNQLRSGIHCPSCFFIPMYRVKRQWHCPACNIYSKDANMQGLRDYFLLIDSKINNKQFRQFADLSSRDVASRLLASTNFPSSGTTKGRFYHPPVDLYGRDNK
ncbi:nuclease-related domain-containing protein [Peribacillus cavernae]|uniref:nuclease-related domain-containing protein n=1 Tax=Peribacillus cavernae TaxID=1674310 RepID=UPI0035229121